MADPTAPSSYGTSDASTVGLLSLLVQMMAQQAGSGATTSNSSDNANKSNSKVPTSSMANTIPKSDASDQYLTDWYGANQGKTVYGPDGTARTIPDNVPKPDAGQYGNYTGVYNGGNPPVGLIRNWIDSDNGILNGASFTNPLLAKAQAMLERLQSTPSANDNSTLVPTPAKAPSAVPTSPATTSYNPANTGAISGLTNNQASQPAVPSVPVEPAPAVPALPSVPVSSVPSDNPPAVTNMINARADQALSNPSLTVSSAQLAGSRTDVSSPFARLSSASYLPDSLSHLSNSVGSYSSPASTGSLAMPSGMTGVSGYIPQSTGGAGMVATAGGQGYVPSTPGAADIVGPSVVPSSGGGFTVDPSVGSQIQPTSSVSGGSGGGGMSPQQASTLASGIQNFGAGISKMFTPGQLGTLTLPTPIPLSQFQVPRMQ